MNAVIEINFAERTHTGQRVGWTRWGEANEYAQGVTELRVTGPVVAAGMTMPRREWDEFVAACGEVA